MGARQRQARGTRGPTAAPQADANPVADRKKILPIPGKGYASGPFEHEPAGFGIDPPRPSRKRGKERHGEPMPKKARQPIESVNDTLKSQLNLDEHAGQSTESVAIRIAQRLLAMPAAIRHHNNTGQPITRFLISFDR